MKLCGCKNQHDLYLNIKSLVVCRNCEGLVSPKIAAEFLNALIEEEDDGKES